MAAFLAEALSFIPTTSSSHFPSQGQPESRKRRETESPYQGINGTEKDFGSSGDRNQELETKNFSDVEDGDLELKEDFFSDSIGLNEFEDGVEEDKDHDESENFRWLNSTNILVHADNIAVFP